MLVIRNIIKEMYNIITDLVTLIITISIAFFPITLMGVCILAEYIVNVIM